MKDEIKEIIDKLEIVARKHTIKVCDNGSKIETMPASVVDELRLNNYSAKLLLDYITNLEEENERLHKELDYANNDNIYYIAKIDKAIEYIKKVIEENEEWTMYREDILLNILKGEDKDE